MPAIIAIFTPMPILRIIGCPLTGAAIPIRVAPIQAHIPQFDFVQPNDIVHCAKKYHLSRYI